MPGPVGAIAQTTGAFNVHAQASTARPLSSAQHIISARVTHFWYHAANLIQAGREGGRESFSLSRLNSSLDVEGRIIDQYPLFYQKQHSEQHYSRRPHLQATDISFSTSGAPCSRHWSRSRGPMWMFLLLLWQPPLGSGMPLHTLQALAPTENKSSHGPPAPSTSPAPPVTPTLLPTHSEPPALSLNLGLNFKIKVRSPGKGRPGEGPGGASAKPGLPPTWPAAPTRSQAAGSRFWTEALGGSGWLGPGPAEELPSGPSRWAWDGAPARAAPGPTLQHPLPLWPRLAEKGLPLPAGEDSKELEFKIDIDLTAGLGKEGSLAPNSSGSGTGWRYPLLPGLSVGISEIASKLGAPGLLGSTPPPETWEPLEWNGTGGAREQPGDFRPTPAWVSGPGLESSSPAASPGGEGAFAALPGCLPEHPEDCGSPLPEPGSPPLSALLLPALPLFVPLHADWNTALAEWGLAWEAHVYGACSLFALLALLSLLGLLGLLGRCPAGCKLLALLQLLLTGAGGARAALLLGDAYGQLELLPDFAVRLLHDLALPCLSSALAVTLLLLSLRPRVKLSAGSSLRHACLLAILVLLHFSVATGAILAADLLHQFPFLLLASRAVFALLAALLSASFLVFYCLARVDTAQIYDLKSAAPPACPCPFADARQWSRAARTALPAASFGLLSAGLHTYAILHVLGYGLSPELFGPWPWWALQLACRLCEAGMGLPLACLGLYPVFCSPAEGCCCPCCGPLLCLSPDHAAVKTQILPNNFQWALSQHEKLVICDTITRSESDYLPLYAMPAEEPGSARGGPCAEPPSRLSVALEASVDPTADFRPPSPIDLRRSIDEALCSEGLFQGGAAAFYASSSLSLRLAGGPSAESDLYRTASCVELVPGRSQADGEASLDASGPNTTLSSPGPWRGSTCSSSLYKQSTDTCSLVLCSSPGGSSSVAPVAYGSPPRSPPLPGRQYWVLTPISQESLASVGQPGADAALLQEEFMDVCRQIDTLSVSSDTIDL
ncbi:proline-rich transmembrane protein 4 [Elgaria multicarinata webbii]|uniref:proline-rich transmembrane protein 4 n=1 Tax=Elgaria multicarinata webbii TaxID=159646 RepID=UPI002FCCF328